MAAYRLADDIQKYLKFTGPVPLLLVNKIKTVPAVVPKKIGTAQASQYYDQALTVTGKVAQVTVRPTITFINLDQPGTSSPFTAVIFKENISLFGDVQKLKGQDVEISGTITEYHDKPQIVLESTNQVKVVTGSK
ncbi:MAG: hypothetical protein WDM80_16625 [Limisphaerales bacterium]